MILAGAGYQYFGDRSYKVFLGDGSGTYQSVLRGETSSEAGGQHLPSDSWQKVGERDFDNAEAHPQLARTYGVDRDVVFVLFEQGRVVKRATAPEVLQAVTAKNGGFYTHEGFLREMEAFANLP